MYAAPFAFTGKIKQVVVDVSDDLIVDDQTKLRRMMAPQ